jgi:hypothetical protein
MKYLLVSVLSLVLALSVGGQVFAQTQMTSTGVNYGSITWKFMPIDKDHAVLIGEQPGVRVDDSGKGPFNNLATHIAMIMYLDKGVAQYHGYETHVDKDGNSLVWEIWGFPAGSNKGKGKLIGATGKFEGMEGTVDFVLQPTPKGFPEGSSRTICKEVWNLTLKNPM